MVLFELLMSLRSNKLKDNSQTILHETFEDFITFNPFVPNAHFLYFLKTSENRKDFWCFQGVEKGCIGDKWINLGFLSP